MKKFILLCVFFSSPFNFVLADDEYSRTVFEAAAFMYWCKFHKIPKNIDDIAKVTEVNDPNPKVTLNLGEWLKTAEFKVVGENLTVIRAFEENELGDTKTRQSTVAMSDCKSFNPPLNRQE